jgi:hypothetical protein
MELPQTGGCQCGALHYEITQAPIMVYTCHCTDCQRMTSSAFGHSRQLLRFTASYASRLNSTANGDEQSPSDAAP